MVTNACQRGTVGLNSLVFVKCSEVPGRCISQQLFLFHCIHNSFVSLQDGLSHLGENKLANGKTMTHVQHESTCQISVLNSVHFPRVPDSRKPQKDSKALTGFFCPGGREATVPVTLTTDSTGASYRTFFRWECACRKKKILRCHGN